VIRLRKWRSPPPKLEWDLNQIGLREYGSRSDHIELRERAGLWRQTRISNRERRTGHRQDVIAKLFAFCCSGLLGIGVFVEGGYILCERSRDASKKAS